MSVESKKNKRNPRLSKKRTSKLRQCFTNVLRTKPWLNCVTWKQGIKSKTIKRYLGQAKLDKHDCCHKPLILYHILKEKTYPVLIKNHLHIQKRHYKTCKCSRCLKRKSRKGLYRSGWGWWEGAAGHFPMSRANSLGLKPSAHGSCLRYPTI